MSHALAILGLIGACLLWYTLQRWAEADATRPDPPLADDCGDCALRDAGCTTPGSVAPPPIEAGGCRLHSGG